jgi:hypothetical protein
MGDFAGGKETSTNKQGDWQDEAGHWVARIGSDLQATYRNALHPGALYGSQP